MGHVVIFVISVISVIMLSRILILPIPDPGSKNSNKREGEKKFVVKPFLLPQISQN
jgi:hypothetical protein